MVDSLAERVSKLFMEVQEGIMSFESFHTSVGCKLDRGESCFRVIAEQMGRDSKEAIFVRKISGLHTERPGVVSVLSFFVTQHYSHTEY